MKKINTLFFLLLISFSVSSQSERWKQKNARINFVVAPQFEFVKIAGHFSPTASLSSSISFNNTYFAGGYMTKKIVRHYEDTPAKPGVDVDVNYQHLGVEFLYSMKLGLYRTKGGHYVHPRLRIIFGGRVGGGTFWLDDLNKDKISGRDYFYFIEPMAGVAYPLNDYITLHGGICFTTALSVDKLAKYFATKDFTGPGVYITAKFTMFR